jgi:DNA uptake protein ComE-like DNA-binding protein
MKRLIPVAPLLIALACAERSQPTDTTAASGATSAATGQTTATTSGGAVQAGGLLDPNTATREELAALPGVDTAVVRIIVSGRPFTDMVAVDRAIAARMDSTQRRALYARVFKPIDLNKATPAEILLIPGVGRRMLHEFEEYRPYKDMAQFRREIGKYVDNTELARLEQYVSVR